MNAVAPSAAAGKRRVAVVTGSRADFGLLVPVMDAVGAHPGLELMVIAAGAHLISPALTFRDVRARYEVADSIPMQIAGRTTRTDDADAVGRGITRFTRSFEGLGPEWVVVLGDRIEAFAAAAAAAIGGRALAHLHGGDRAEGVADEAMRHAISKLAHLHLPATPTSAQRLVRMGESESRVRLIGSPAIDGLAAIEPLTEEAMRAWGEPEIVVLLHPVGRDEGTEYAAAKALIEVCRARGRVLVLDPNHDPGRAGTDRAIAESGLARGWHMPREKFVGLLRWLAARGGVLAGNSSAGLIEACALGVKVLDVGPRQTGRERATWVVHAEESADDLRRGLEAAFAARPDPAAQPYGDGRAGERAAAALAEIDPKSPGLLRKLNTY